MATVCPPAADCKQIDVGGRRYSVGGDGLFHGVADAHVRAMKDGAECFTPATRMGTGKGWICNDCGFAAAIKHCGRCGSEDLTKEV